MTLFFNHFKVQCGLATHTRGCGLIHLVPIVHGFGAFLENLKRFEDRFFLIASFASRLMQHYTSSETEWTSGALTCSPRTRTRVIFWWKMVVRLQRGQTFPWRSISKKCQISYILLSKGEKQCQGVNLEIEIQIYDTTIESQTSFATKMRYLNYEVI